MRVIAMYLPQFHRVRENDEWWGEGFTEWTTVKNATPLYNNHIQPRVPLNNFYYDLLNKSVMEWQADLMKEYGIDGICLYHYWFKDGRKILERPVENLLKWTDIDMPFCLCWANETWARSWSGLVGSNAWADRFENDDHHINKNRILLEQKYGLENEWSNHFDYLSRFFVDKRYIKIDGKPLVLIYKCNAISLLDKMIHLWREMARKQGFPDLYVIGGDASMIPDDVIDGRMIKEPQNESGRVAVDNRNGVLVKQYDEFWYRILHTEELDVKTYYTGFVGYDDTPRRGTKGYVVEGGSPDKFCDNMYRLMVKNYRNNKHITFLNAWNEWGEGMYLEPDERNGYDYLKYLKEAKQRFEQNHETSNWEIDNNISVLKPKDTIYLHLLHKWMKLREKGVKLESYFVENGFCEIAIYGYSIFADHLIEELNSDKVSVRYLIDKNDVNVKIPIYKISEKKPRVDVVVVCSFYYFREIYSELKGAGMNSIVSIESIINEMC